MVTGGSVRRHLGNARIRTKLGLILMVPAVAVLGLGGYLLTVTVQQAARASHGLALTELAGAAGDLAFALELERAAAASALLSGAGNPERDAFAARVAETDGALAGFAAARVGVRTDRVETAATLARADAGVRDLPGLRVFVTSGERATWSAAVLRYRLLIADLLALRQAPALAGLPAELADRVRAASALSEAVEQLGLQHVAVLRAAVTERLTPAALGAIVTAGTGFAEARQSFVDLADPAWRAWWDNGVSGEAVVAAAGMQGVVARTRADEHIAIDLAAWTTAMLEQMRLTHQVQSRVDSEVLAAVRAERDRQIRAAIVSGGSVTVVLAVAVSVAARVARSMARRLRLLREGALHVAHQELPDVVAKLAEPRGLVAVTPQHVVESAVIPVRVDGRDEIGEVAEAFVAVSREAVRHAAEQALLRSHVAAMFVAMARRLQQLTDAMMRQLDTLERGETDEKRLADLFALDHVGTRIGRYTDSLLVVSGTASSRRRATPVDLLDVLRAAVGQVQDYRRVQYGVVDHGVSVVAHAVDHVVHALAELIDNACVFSPPEQAVVVEGRRIGADTLIEVTDRGIGLSESALAELNGRLAQPPRMDVRSLRSIGIATVAAIAAWHGLRVSLAPGDGGGTSARVVVPPEVTIRAPRHLHPRDVPPPLWPMVPRLLERPGTVVAGVPWPRTSPEALSTQPRTGVYRSGEAARGWRAAAAAAEPSPGGTSDVGLPVRTPMAQLVPGAIGGPAGENQASAGTGAAERRVPRDAHAVSAAMRSYQLGLMQGRAGARFHRPPPPAPTNYPRSNGGGSR